VANILVVEDEAEARGAIVRILRAEGHAVREAVDGRDGLDQFYLHKPQLIICDILMPQRDGIEMIGGLRGAAIQAPIIAMLEVDAAQAPLLLDLAIAFGANAVLLKPVTGHELRATVASLLAPAGARRQSRAH
jgi:CheY-like chemotaxis protein